MYTATVSVLRSKARYTCIAYLNIPDLNEAPSRGQRWQSLDGHKHWRGQHLLFWQMVVDHDCWFLHVSRKRSHRLQRAEKPAMQSSKSKQTLIRQNRAKCHLAPCFIASCEGYSNRLAIA